jgi:hypothetical protein
MFLVVGKGVFNTENLVKFLTTRGIVDAYSEIQKIQTTGCMEYGKYRIMAFR